MTIFDQVFQCILYHHVKNIENNDDAYRDKDRRKKFCKPLRVHAMEIVNFEKKFTKSNLILVLN